ncbi:MAG: inositol monophosphatase family protein [Acetobacteraceae bacterium]|nr:inositol monophosphatase family protein [Acetobacteraceae bacterium]
MRWQCPARPPRPRSRSLDREALVAAAQAAADVAGAVIRPFFRSNLTIAHKADRTPVTIADRTAEQAMRAVLSERFPEHGLQGEEFGIDLPEARLRWVLDPIDGTKAFITGRPQFGTLIALMEDGVPILGIIDQPVTRERWIGVAGERTRFLGMFGTPACRPCPSLSDAELSCTGPHVLGGDSARWEWLADQVRRVSWGGDCYAYGLLALGQIDLIAESTMKVWDWAALVPVIEGAGGRITDWDGQPLHPDGDGRVLAAGDPILLQAAVSALAS